MSLTEQDRARVRIVYTAERERLMKAADVIEELEGHFAAMDVGPYKTAQTLRLVDQAQIKLKGLRYKLLWRASRLEKRLRRLDDVKTVRILDSTLS